MAPEYFPDDAPARTMTPAERRTADLDALDAAEQWGADRRAGRITDPGCESVSAWLDRDRLSDGQKAQAFYAILDGEHG